jgi:hypothetical protein
VCRASAAAVILAVSALSPRFAECAPIVIEHTIADPFAPATVAGVFTFDNDVALFRFELDPGAFSFEARTTSYTGGGFDPILALYGPDNRMVTYAGGTLFAKNDHASDLADPGAPLVADSLLQLILEVGQRSMFTLALVQGGNNPHEDSLGFDWDDDLFRCATSFSDPCGAGEFVDWSSGLPTAALLSNFSLDLAVAPADSAPIPEPGTLSLMAIGSAGAALLRRRGSRRTNRQ